MRILPANKEYNHDRLVIGNLLYASRKMSCKFLPEKKVHGQISPETFELANIKCAQSYLCFAKDCIFDLELSLNML